MPLSRGQLNQTGKFYDWDPHKNDNEKFHDFLGSHRNYYLACIQILIILNVMEAHLTGKFL